MLQSLLPYAAPISRLRVCVYFARHASTLQGKEGDINAGRIPVQLRPTHLHSMHARQTNAHTTTMISEQGQHVSRDNTSHQTRHQLYTPYTRHTIALEEAQERGGHRRHGARHGAFAPLSCEPPLLDGAEAVAVAVLATAMASSAAAWPRRAHCQTLQPPGMCVMCAVCGTARAHTTGWAG